MNPEEKERTELTHEPVKGYAAAFYILFGLALAYLAIIFIASV